MHRILLWTAFIRLYGFIGGEKGDENCSDLDKLLLTTTETLTKLVEPISSRLGNVSGRLDRISKKIEIQKSTIESLKSAHNPWNERIGVLEQKIGSFHQKQLKDWNATTLSMESLAKQLVEIKNITVIQFPRILEKLATTNDIVGSVLGLSAKLENLTGAYTKQETKLGNVHDTLTQAKESISNAIANNTKRIETMQNDMLKALEEESEPLSSEAISHVNKVANIAKIISMEMKRFDGLEPKLLHLYHLSVNLQKELPNNPVVSDLTTSLRALKNSGPSIVSSISKNVEDLSGALQDLQALSKDNNCPADLTLEIHNHHNKIIKYLNDSISGREDAEHEAWRGLMKKLQNIERSSEAGSSINEKLMKLREQISAIRDLLQEQSEEHKANDDRAFG